METTYYVYEIVGKKVGCTKHLDYRMKIQEADDYRVIAATKDIQEASKLEIEWQERLGYRKDVESYESVVKRIGSTSQSAKIKIAKVKKGNQFAYGRGKLYRELSTGFEGYCTDQLKRFNINCSYLDPNRLGKTKTKGNFKGMCWIEI